MRMNRSRAYRNGFSLVELLVYLASMTLILLALSYVLANTYATYAAMVAGARADRALGTLMQVLSTEIRSGSVIDQSASVFNTDNGRLAITALDGTIATSRSFFLENGRVVFRADGSDTYMTPEDMTVAKLRFAQIVTPISYAVRYEVTVTYPIRGETVAKTYPGVAILRHSYE